MDPEDRLVTTTPDGIDLEVVLAGAGSRFAAILLDTLVQVLLYVLLFAVVLRALIAGATGIGIEAAFLVLSFLIFFGYFVVLESATGGRTLGKLAFGLRAVRLDGRPVGFLTSLVRTVLRIADYLPPFCPLGAILIFVTGRHQRLGDMAARTIVVRERRAAVPVPKADQLGWRAVTASTGHPAVGWDVTGVTNEQVAILERFLASRHGYRPAARAELAAQLQSMVAPGVAGAPTGLDPERFVEGVVAAKTGLVAPRYWEPAPSGRRRRRSAT